MRELNGDHVPETEEYGISSTVFRATRPFHPARLWDSVTTDLDDEHALGAQGWSAWHDPFPVWETYGLDETCDHEHGPHEAEPVPVP